LEALPAAQGAGAEVGGSDIQTAQAVAVIPGDDAGGRKVDGLKLPAPETLHGRSECLETFEQEVTLEGEMAHLIAQELFGDRLHDRIAAT